MLVPGGVPAIHTPNRGDPVERLKERDLLLARNETHIALRHAPTLAHALRGSGFAIGRDEWRPGVLPGVGRIERLAGGRLPALR